MCHLPFASKWPKVRIDHPHFTHIESLSEVEGDTLFVENEMENENFEDVDVIWIVTPDL